MYVLMDMYKMGLYLLDRHTDQQLPRAKATGLRHLQPVEQPSLDAGLEEPLPAAAVAAMGRDPIGCFSFA